MLVLERAGELELGMEEHVEVVRPPEREDELGRGVGWEAGDRR